MTRRFKFRKFDLELDKRVMPLTSDAIFLGAWTLLQPTAKSVLDIGTGTGVLSLMLAQKYASQLEQITAIDIDKTSCDLARKNALASSWPEILNVKHLALQDLVNQGGASYDHIVSNPPFFVIDPQKTRETMRRSKHMDQLSSCELLEGISQLLKPNGIASLILPAHNIDGFLDLMKQKKMHLLRQCIMYPRQGRVAERVLLDIGKSHIPCFRETIVMYDGENYTEAYEELTSEFYLKN